MNPVRNLQYSAFMALVLVAGLYFGCASIGITPDTLNQKIAVALSANTAVRNTATQLLTAGKITADDASNVLASTDAARAGIDLARTLGKTDLTAADAKLTAATTVLTALQAYLATRGAK